MVSQEVLFQEIPGAGGDLGKIILNRPQQLNALTFEMCAAIKKQLETWSNQPAIKAVLMTGVGDRAFCAGGDIRTIYKLCAEEKNEAEVFRFFQTEYRLDRLIFDFPKPYIAFLDGIAMGGGVGISIHGSHTVATKRLSWAMPETSIGFFPDVGAGYHLARMPGYAGFYLGLTGEKITAADAYRLGLIQAIVPRAQWQQLEQALAQTPFLPDDRDAVTKIILAFHQPSAQHETVHNIHLEKMAQYFSGPSLEAIIGGLEHARDPWCDAVKQTLAIKSPLSLKVTDEHLRHCLQMNFAEVMLENEVLAKNFLHGADFMEGIRAAIIAKDRRPKWQPAVLSSITPALLRRYFTP